MRAHHSSLIRTSYASVYASHKPCGVLHTAPAPDHRQLGGAPLGVGAHGAGGERVGWMLGAGLRPDAPALAAAVRSASALPDGGGGGALGRCLHGFAVKAGRVAGSVAVAKAVMDMYGRSGPLSDARIVFDEMTRPDAVCWNILITASSRARLFDDTLGLFWLMLVCGAGESMPTVVTVAVIVPVCVKLRHLLASRSVHGCHQDWAGIRYTVWKCIDFDVCKMWWKQSNG